VGQRGIRVEGRRGEPASRRLSLSGLAAGNSPPSVRDFHPGVTVLDGARLTLFSGKSFAHSGETGVWNSNWSHRDLYHMISDNQILFDFMIYLG